MANAIATEIRLAGAEEIKRILAELGVAGEKAFGQVREAVDLANTRLERVAKAVEAVGASARRVADAGRNFGQAFNGLNDSLGRLRSSAADTARRFALLSGTIIGAGIGLAAFVKSGLSAADDLIKQSQAVGLSIEAYQKLGFAASQAGVDQQSFATGVARFSQEVTTQAAEQRKALSDFANAAVQSMSKAGIVTVGFAKTASANFQLIGDTARQVQAQLRSRGIDIPISVITAKLQEMAAGTGEARKQFEQLTGQSLSGAQAALQKLGLEGDKSAKSLQTLGVNVLDARGNVRELPDLLGEVADKFAAMPDGIEKTSLAARLFGRTAGPLMIPLLNQGSKAIRDLGEEYRATGLLVTKEQAQIAENANDAVSALGFTISAARTQFSILFGPGIKRAADALNAAFIRNVRTLQDFGRTIANQVEPVLLDLVKLLEGRDNEIQNQWILTARKAIVDFATAVKGAVTNIIIPAYTALLAGMRLIADTFNKVFGTELTGGQLLAALAITKLLGLFGLLGAAISVIGNTIRVFVSGLILLVRNFALIGAAARALGVTLSILIPKPALVAIGLLVGALVLAATHFDELKAAMQPIAELLNNLFGTKFFDQITLANAAVVGLISLVAVTFVAGVRNAAAALLLFSKRFAFLAVIVLGINELIAAWERFNGKVNASGAGTDSAFDKLIDNGKKLVSGLEEAGNKTSEFGQRAKEVVPFVHDVQAELAKIGTRTTGGIVDVPEHFRRAGQAAQEASQGVQTAQQRINDAFSQLSQGSQQAGQSVDQLRTKFTEPLPAESLLSPFIRTVLAFLPQIESIKSSLERLKTTILGVLPPGLFDGIIPAWRGAITSFTTFVETSFQRLLNLIERIRRGLSSTSVSANEFLGSGGGGFASGGYTGSIGRTRVAGVVHGGEYVQPARVVAKPGVMDFMETLRRTGDLQKTINVFVRGFSLGGLVNRVNASLALSIPPMAIPQFQSGGLVPAAAGGRHLGSIDLRIGSGAGKTFRVFGDDETAQSLSRFATLERLRSAGRKPSSEG